MCPTGKFVAGFSQLPMRYGFSCDGTEEMCLRLNVLLCSSTFLGMGILSVTYSRGGGESFL